MLFVTRKAMLVASVMFLFINPNRYEHVCVVSYCNDFTHHEDVPQVACSTMDGNTSSVELIVSICIVYLYVTQTRYIQLCYIFGGSSSCVLWFYWSRDLEL